MPPPNDPNAPRHARLFEFLRQSHQADMTSKRLSQPSMRMPTGPMGEDWCARAVKSLGADSAQPHKK